MTMPSTRPSSRANDFDHHDPALADRIHDEYDALRAECPVGWSERHGGFWVVTAWQDLHDLARDAEALSSRVGLIPNVMGDNVLIPISLDPPEHAKYRNLLQRWFTPNRVADFEPFIRSRAREMLASLSSPTDLATEFARPFPLEVILKVIGVPDHDFEPVAAGARAVIDEAGGDPVAAFAKVERALVYLATELVPMLRENPGDDLVSFLIGAEVDGAPLPDPVIASIAFNVVGAGFDTTFKSLSSFLAFLAAHPEHQEAVRKSGDLRVAVEELLRLFAPVSVGREVRRDMQVGGVELKAGDPVLLAFPAGGRDPQVFENPDVPDFERQPNKHLAFGTGIHRCLGMHLARAELVVALEEIFRAMSWFEIEPGRTPAYGQSQVWGAVSVPVAFTPA